MTDQARLKLKNGSRVAVIGGGPAGSLFSYFLLDMAERARLDLHVDIFEPRDLEAPAPRSCNMCAGVLHESLVQALATEGIELPLSIVQRGLRSNTLHMDVGQVQIETPRQEKRIATTFRGSGPRDMTEVRGPGLDGYLLKLAERRGANPVHERVDKVAWSTDPESSDAQARQLRVQTRDGNSEIYDLVAVTAGVNTAVLKQFEALGIPYRAPRTTKCHVREYHLGAETVTRYFGTSMHAFLLNIPRLDFGALIPKGEYVTLSLLGENIDDDLVQAFLNDPAVKRCLPPNFVPERFACSCGPRINVQGSAQPFGDRLVFIGDCGVTRLYKDGIGSAYRAGKVAASTAIFRGIAEHDFRRHYAPFCRTVRIDNAVGKLIFTIVRQIQKIRPARDAILRMVAAEQRDHARAAAGMSMVLWDMFTGSASYREVFWRTLHPAFWTRLFGSTVAALLTLNRGEQASSEATPVAEAVPNPAQHEEEVKVQLGALGKLYADGEIIIRQGDLGNSMFVIQEGRVEIIEELGGQFVRLAVREKGEFFGEMSIFERQVRSATVRALGPARVLTVDEKTLLRRIHEDPSLAYRMVRTMSHRIRELSGEVALLKSPEPAEEWSGEETLPPRPLATFKEIAKRFQFIS